MRGFLLWLLSLIAGAFRAFQDVIRQEWAQVQSQERQIVYPQFEAAIAAWEKRTGRVVERTFRELNEDEAGYTGKDWQNFSAFLGSREAQQWRRNNAVEQEAVLNWGKEPDMWVEGEEEKRDEAH